MKLSWGPRQLRNAGSRRNSIPQVEPPINVFDKKGRRFILEVLYKKVENLGKDRMPNQRLKIFVHSFNYNLEK